MRKLCLLLGMHSPMDVKTNNTPEFKAVERPFDAQAYAAWCKEFNVSRMTNRNGRFTVRVGQKEKVVEPDTIPHIF